MGSLSWQALMRKTPSGVTGLYSTPANGRLWPGQTKGRKGRGGGAEGGWETQDNNAQIACSLNTPVLHYYVCGPSSHASRRRIPWPDARPPPPPTSLVRLSTYQWESAGSALPCCPSWLATDAAAAAVGAAAGGRVLVPPPCPLASPPVAWWKVCSLLLVRFGLKVEGRWLSRGGGGG